MATMSEDAAPANLGLSSLSVADHSELDAAARVSAKANLGECAAPIAVRMQTLTRSNCGVPRRHAAPFLILPGSQSRGGQYPVFFHALPRTEEHWSCRSKADMHTIVPAN